MDQVSQIRSSQYNASSLYQQPYVSQESSLVVGREGLSQVDLGKSFERPILTAIPTSAEVPILKQPNS